MIPSSMIQVRSKVNHEIFFFDLASYFAVDFKKIHFARSACPYGTVFLTLEYRQAIAFPDR